MATLVDQITNKVLTSLGVDAACPPPVHHDPDGFVGKWVVVTTDSRDLWYGKVVTYQDRIFNLANARNVYYYAAFAGEASQKGVGSLATVGPATGSKIGPEVLAVSLRNVSCVLLCSEVAENAFAAQGWAK